MSAPQPLSDWFVDGGVVYISDRPVMFGITVNAEDFSDNGEHDLGHGDFRADAMVDDDEGKSHVRFSVRDDRTHENRSVFYDGQGNDPKEALADARAQLRLLYDLGMKAVSDLEAKLSK